MRAKEYADMVNDALEKATGYRLTEANYLRIQAAYRAGEESVRNILSDNYVREEFERAVRGAIQRERDRCLAVVNDYTEMGQGDSVRIVREILKPSEGP
jgi:putative IMPACT (imprinted ancient) family translation regulator